MAVQVREQGSHHRFQVKLRVTGTVTALLVLQFPSLRASLRVTVGTVSSAQPWSSDPESTAARPLGVFSLPCRRRSRRLPRTATPEPGLTRRASESPGPARLQA